ncbi:hypothetical protein ACJIZ3_007167 [Penstemon smallii]|uniref:DUF641 domain-containing protein n=1 Tax=Penstemon smallii TaxID=265156 RepID=A0ABD3S9X5_9LAMI
MDSVKRSSITPKKSRLARTFAKVLHIKSHEKLKKDGVEVENTFDDEDEELRLREAFLAKLFASISTIKAAYAELQLSQCPYDVDGIQSADQVVVSELKNLSELKQSYLKKQLNETSPETTMIMSEIQEQKSLLKIYEITSKKLDSQIKLKESEITFLKEKLAEANKDNRSLEKRLNSSGQLAMPDNIQLSSLKPSHFISYFRQAMKSIRGFVRLLISEMESSNWDLDSAACSIEPGISFWKPNHKCFAFESYVCKEMFDGFNYPNFSLQTESLNEQEKHQSVSFDRFLEMKTIKPADYLSWKPRSLFATFCRRKYMKLVHPKMEESLFGNLDQRNLVSSGKVPETSLFLAFIEMAKRVWLLQCLALSFDPEVSIFQVKKGSRFSEVYMESLSDEAFLSFDPTSPNDPRVAFTVVPGFRVGTTIIQSQVYLI